MKGQRAEKRKKNKTKDINLKKWNLSSQKHMRMCLALLVIKEMQIKSTINYHYTYSRFEKIMNLTTPTVGEDVNAMSHFIYHW